MEPATILVLVLCAGVAGLLVWFEINSRRNEATTKQTPTVAQPTLGSLQKKDQSTAKSVGKRNAA